MLRLRTTVPALLGSLVLVVLAPAATAQYAPSVQRPTAGPYQRSTISPYLNLLRGGNPAANYFLGVLPEVNQRSLNAQYGSAILGLERRAAPPRGDLPELEEALPTLPSTGHPAVFGNVGSYFGGAPRAGGSTRAPAPARRGPPAPAQPAPDR